jgi:hypothetical protein
MRWLSLVDGAKTGAGVSGCWLAVSKEQRGLDGHWFLMIRAWLEILSFFDGALCQLSQIGEGARLC